MIDVLVPLLYFLLIALTVRLILSPWPWPQTEMRATPKQSEPDLLLTEADVFRGLPLHIQQGMLADDYDTGIDTFARKLRDR